MNYKDKILDEYEGKGSPKFKDLSNKNFGDWKVICRAPSSETKKTLFWCECSCGRIQKVHSTHLIRGLTHKCLKCSARLIENPNGNLKKGDFRINLVGDIPVSFWKEFKKRAFGEKSRQSRRNLKFEITLEDAWNLYLKQNKKCALSGLDIGFCVEAIKDSKGHIHKWKHTASLDRIDSKKDYILENVQWVHKDVNFMKNVFDQNYFIKICKLISERNNK